MLITWTVAIDTDAAITLTILDLSSLDKNPIRQDHTQTIGK